MRTRSISRALRHQACLVFLALCASATPASAQGFFETLFGFGSRPPRSAPVDRPPNAATFGYRTPLYYPDRQGRQGREGEQREAQPGKYRTLCVRMCDGYYFPISENASRSAFYKDANVCRARCGGEARLFHYTVKSEEPADMVDTSGRAYSQLPTAFLYRKTYVSGCKCKPDPWSQSELRRHDTYARDERVKETEQADAASNDGDEPARHEVNRAPTIAKLEAPREPAAPDNAVTGDASSDAERPAEILPAVADASSAQSVQPATPESNGIVPPAPRRAIRPPAQTRNRPAVRRASAKSGGNLFGGGSTLRWPGD